MGRRSWFLTVLVTLILGTWARPTSAQVGAASAQLNGAVRDASSGSVAKASVTLRNTETNLTYNAVSNENGLYMLTNVTPKQYELTASATGFAKTTLTKIEL